MAELKDGGDEERLVGLRLTQAGETRGSPLSINEMQGSKKLQSDNLTMVQEKMNSTMGSISKQRRKDRTRGR